MTDIVERLRMFRPPYGYPEEYGAAVAKPLNEEAADEITRLRALLDEAREIVRPFADVAGNHIVVGKPDRFYPEMRLTYFRRAAAWLEKDAYRAMIAAAETEGK